MGREVGGAEGGGGAAGGRSGDWAGVFLLFSFFKFLMLSLSLIFLVALITLQAALGG